MAPLSIKGAVIKLKPLPLDAEWCHPLVADFSRSYIRHLFRAGEILGLRLICVHNLHFYQSLVRGAREALEAGTFAAYRAAFLTRYSARTPAPTIP